MSIRIKVAAEGLICRVMEMVTEHNFTRRAAARVLLSLYQQKKPRIGS